MKNKAVFKKLNGTPIENVVDYVKSWLETNKHELPVEGTAVYIGTDSQVYRGKIRYATVICLRRKSKGVHVIRKVENMKATNDSYKRLWDEVVHSMDTANELIKDGFLTPDEITIHLDYNPSPEHPSNTLFDSAMGMVKGYGIKVEGKPMAWAASVCADRFSR